MSFGSLIIRIPSAKDSQNQSKKDVLVEVRLPDGLGTESAVKSEPVDGYQFKFNAEVNLKARITNRSKVKICVYEYNRILANNLLGSGELTLDALAQGNNISDQEVEISDHVRVVVSMNWKNPPADAFASVTGESSSPGAGGPPAGTASSGAALAPLLSSGGSGSRAAAAKLLPLPDPAGQNYGVRVKIHRLKNLQSSDPEKLYDPRCIVRVAKQSFKTEVVKQNNEPVFDEEASFNFEKVDAHFWTETLSINVASNRFGLPDEQIGLIQFDLGSIYRSNAAHALIRKWFVICRAVGDGTVMGYCKASIAVFNLRSDAAIELDDGADDQNGDDEDDDDVTSNLINIPGAVFEEMNLNCRIIRGRGLPKMDAGLTGSCDPYVKISFGTESRSTSWIDGTFDPDWRTNFNIPCMMPMLTNYLQVALWDHDVASPDDLIATKMIDVNEMRDGRTGQVPLLYPRWFNFYGHPRACDADLTRYYKKMAKGLAPPVDFRGRALIGFTGIRNKGEALSGEPIPESRLRIQFKAEILQLSHLSLDDEVKIRVACGTQAGATNKRKMTRMQGEGARGYHCYIGDTVSFTAELPIVIPPHDREGSYLASDLKKDDRGAKTIWNQIPDIIVHIIPISTLGRIADAVTGALDEEPVAALIIPAEKFLYAENNRVFISSAMDTMQDPDSVSDGGAPTNPLIQVNASMVITSIMNPPPEFDIKHSTYSSGIRVLSSVDEVFKPVVSALNSRPRDFLLQTKLYHARNLPAGDSSGLSDPYVVVSWANASGCSGRKDDTLNPCWNEVINMVCSVYDPLPDILLELWDHDMIGADTFLAKCLVRPQDIVNRAKDNNSSPFWLDTWVDARGSQLSDTSLLVKFNILPSSDPAAQKLVAEGLKSKTAMPHNKAEPTKTYMGIPLAPDDRLETANFSLNLKVIALRKMRKFRLRKISTPKIVFEAYGERVEVANADDLLNFNQELGWTIPLPTHAAVPVLPNLSVTVYDRRLGSDSLIAVAQIPLDSDMLSAPKKKELESRQNVERAERLKSIILAHRKIESEASVFDTADDGFGDGGLQEAGTRGAGASGTGGKNQQNSLYFSSPREQEITRGTTTSSSSSPPHDFDAAAAPDPRKPSSVADAGPEQQDASSLNVPLVNRAEQRSGDDPAAAVQMTRRPGGNTRRYVNDTINSSNSNLAAAVDVDDETDGVAGGSLRLRIERAIDNLEESEKAEYDVASDVSSEPDEPLWFDRFEPSSALNDACLVRPEQRVARFGKLGRYSTYFRNGKTSAEDVYGPFNDGKLHLQLYRGWGSDAIKAGTLLLEANLEKLPVAATAAAAAAAAVSGTCRNKSQQPGSASSNQKSEFKQIESRKRLPFLCRVYILQCRELTPMDSGLLGSASDPYVVLRLSSGSDETNFFGGDSGGNDVVVSCRDQTRYQVNDPEFFFVRELSGELPRHSVLRVSVFDYDKIGRDELIGFTDVNIEERYYSERCGYAAPRVELAPGVQFERQNAAAFYGLNHYGSYTERRRLQTTAGLTAGTIELWIDVFDFSVPVPRPIDIAPPPPIPMELRCTVWNVRDCDLTDEAITGELMTDIYVRCWVDGMLSNKQNTDVHYRSLDGSGSFNWRMLFPLVFDPRLKKVFAYVDGGSTSTSESGGASSSAISKFFGVRKEAKKLKPRLKVQLWDNDLFPGTDDYIGDATLDLTALLPAFTRREKIGLARGLTDGCRSCWQRCPCSKISACQCAFCMPKGDIGEMDLPQRQEYAKKERERERHERIRQINEDVELKLKNIGHNFNEVELKKVRERLFVQAKKASKINIFKDFLPQGRKRSQKDAADAKFNHDVQRKVQRFGVDDASSIASKNNDDDTKSLPAVSEIPRQWFICRSPLGGCRVGDVQLSFELVRLDALAENEKLTVGKGRADPQAMPEPDRPDSSFFWLSSPWKAAVHIFWKNYKWWIITILCLVLVIILSYDFLAETVAVKARNIFV